jgi:superfamily II DNA or RNA helicase
VTLFSKQDVLRGLGPVTVEKGTAMLAEDRVRLVEASNDGANVSGRVADGYNQSYSQTIRLISLGRDVKIKGYCTCPIGFNCKHVAAVLLKHLALNVRQADAVATGAGGCEAHNAAGASESAISSKLSFQVSNWLDRLTSAMSPPISEDRHAVLYQRLLLFVLNYEHSSLTSRAAPVRVRAVTVRLCVDGRVSDVKHCDPEKLIRNKQPRAHFLTETDLDLLRDLWWLERTNEFPGQLDIALGADPESLRMTQALLATGRLRYGAPDGPVLGTGPAVRAAPRWIKFEQGGQKLTLVPLANTVPASDGRLVAQPEQAPARFDTILPLSPPHYVDLSTGHVGAIEADLPPQIAAEVVRAPIITAAEAAVVKELMQRRLKTPPVERCSQPSPDGTQLTAADDIAPLPLPEAADSVETRIITPIPRLELIVAQVSVKPGLIKCTSEPFRLPLARLSFNYGGEIVASNCPVHTLERIDGDRLILTPRDAQREATASERLAGFGLKPVGGMPFEVSPENSNDLFIGPPGHLGASDLIASADVPNRYIAFSQDAVPKLLTEGWEVAVANDYPYRLAEGDTQWWVNISENSGIDWFCFELGIEFDGHRINLVPHLLQMLNQLPAEMIERAFLSGEGHEIAKLCERRNLYHTLPDGRLLPLPGARLAPLLKGLVELIGPRGQRLDDGKVKLHRAEAVALAVFAGQTCSDFVWAADAKRLVELGNSLRRGRSIEAVAPPSTFQAQLRPYQADGLAWLDFLRDAGFGGLLADDMGLGKTVQALAFLSNEKAQGRLDKPALIVCPTTVLPNWQNEAARFTPDLSVLALRGLDRKQYFSAIPKSHLVITTYPLLMRDHEVLLAQEFHVAILDEAQAIKNPRATVSALAHRINARHRLALTGTPLENNLGEVWSLFEFLSPGLLGDEATFRRTFRTPIEKHGDVSAQAFLSRRLKPFMLRRTKGEVAKELPPKSEIIERVRLEGAQRDLYETVRSLMHAKVQEQIATKGIAKSHIIVLDALLKLRQVCCDPRLLKMPQARRVKESAKLERLMEMIPELVDEGRRILLFSQFTSMLELIEAELKNFKIPYVQITGQTTDRATPVKAFQSGKVPLFLLSLKAGGTGLNLTAADTVIHYDPWWNPAVENQATDRAYRIGQDKPVFVYKLLVEEGIEEAIEQLKARKSALADALFAGSAKTPLDLTEADISALFAPLDRRLERRAA